MLIDNGIVGMLRCCATSVPSYFVRRAVAAEKQQRAPPSFFLSSRVCFHFPLNTTFLRLQSSTHSLQKSSAASSFLFPSVIHHPPPISTAVQQRRSIKGKSYNMCYDGSVRYSCGHFALISESTCKELLDLPFPIKVQCPRYVFEFEKVEWPCGIGRFYCGQTEEGQLFNGLYALIGEITQRGEGLHASEARIRAGQQAAFANQMPTPGAPLPPLLAVYGNTLDEIHQLRQHYVQVIGQATEILQHAPGWMERRQALLARPATFPLDPLTLTPELRLHLTDEVREIFEQYERALRGAIPGELLEPPEDDADAHLQPAPPVNPLTGQQNAVGNLENIEMARITAPMPVPIIYGREGVELARRESERLKNKRVDYSELSDEDSESSDNDESLSEAITSTRSSNMATHLSEGPSDGRHNPGPTSLVNPRVAALRQSRPSAPPRQQQQQQRQQQPAGYLPPGQRMPAPMYGRAPTTITGYNPAGTRDRLDQAGQMLGAAQPGPANMLMQAMPTQPVGRLQSRFPGLPETVPSITTATGPTSHYTGPGNGDGPSQSIWFAPPTVPTQPHFQQRAPSFPDLRLTNFARLRNPVPNQPPRYPTNPTGSNPQATRSVQGGGPAHEDDDGWSDEGEDTHMTGRH